MVFFSASRRHDEVAIVQYFVVSDSRLQDAIATSLEIRSRLPELLFRVAGAGY
jgi:hypothetical protein